MGFCESIVEPAGFIAPIPPQLKILYCQFFKVCWEMVGTSPLVLQHHQMSPSCRPWMMDARRALVKWGELKCSERNLSRCTLSMNATWTAMGLSLGCPLWKAGDWVPALWYRPYRWINCLMIEIVFVLPTRSGVLCGSVRVDERSWSAGGGGCIPRLPMHTCQGEALCRPWQELRARCDPGERGTARIPPLPPTQLQ
jgi:hypothetical protein